MEINYNLIIKYLTKPNQNNPSKKQTNTFSTQKNIFNYSVNFPDKFKNMLPDKFYRYGVTINDNENNNISLWSSLLTLLDKNFLIPYQNDELEVISKFKTQILDKFTKNNVSQIFKSLEKEEMRTRLKMEPDILVLQLIVDVLDLNIIIFDFDSINLFGLFKRDILNPWKQTIFLANYKNYWEPIMLVKLKGDSQRLFDYHDQIFRKILTYDIKYYQGDKINKEFIYSDDLGEVINQEKKKIEILFIKNNKSKNKNPDKNPEKNMELENMVSKKSHITTNDSYPDQNVSLSDDTKQELIDETIHESETENNSESSVKTDSDDNVFIEKDEYEELKKLNKTKLLKMKVAELWEIVDKLKMQVDKKNPTKNILVESILKKL